MLNVLFRRKDFNVVRQPGSRVSCFVKVSVPG